MRKLNNLKSALLLTVALLTSGMAFADTETNLDAKGGSASSEAVIGESYTVNGTYIAGGGSAMAGTMNSKGFKLRTGNDGNRAVFTVNKPYVINKLVIEGISNYAAIDTDNPAYVVTSVEVDGAAISTWEGGQFPGKATGESAFLTIRDIAAKESIAIYFDNNNADGKQINAVWEVTYSAPEASEPTIFVEPESIRLIPGVTYQLNSKIIPSSFTDLMWYTGDVMDYYDGARSEVVSVDETGLITTLAPGTEDVKLTWMQNPGGNEDTCTVTVTDFYPAAHEVLKKIDFTTMGDVTLTTGSGAGNIWNDANSQTNAVFWCANEGLEELLFQAVISDNNSKGWKIVDGEGLNLTGAGRCAGIGGLSAGQYVEVVYTGNTFAVRDRGMGELKNGQDISVIKEVINEEPGRAIFQVLPDEENADLQDNNGVLGFEIARGAYVKSITVYGEASDPSGITNVKTQAESEALYNLMGIRVNGNAKGLLIKNGKKLFVK